MADSNFNFDEIKESAGFAQSAFGDLNTTLGEIRKNSTLIGKELKSFVSSTSAANSLAKELNGASEKTLKSKKDLNILESATQKTQKEIQKITTEINVFSQRRLKATEAEKNEIDRILKLKGDQLDNAKLLVSSANELLEVSKNQTSNFKTITDEIKKIQGINNMLSVSFFGLQMLKISEQTADFQKSLLLSAGQAQTLRQEFVATANASNDTFITTNKLIEANAALGKQLGFNKNFGADLNTEFVNLTKRVGLSEEAAAGFAKASVLSGKTLKSTAESAAGIVSSVSSQYGIQLDIKDVLNEAGASSSLMLSNFKGNIPALVEGISKMKALGTSLSQTDQQAASLLDFQSSIENTLKASLFTGRQINLEKARELALNNDLTGVAEELSKQQMNFGEFGKMNRIQQDAFAQSLGLSRDTLADQLAKQAVQGKLQSDIVSTSDKEAYARVQTLNAQEKFNSAIEKMSDLFGNLAAGPLGKLVDLMAKLAENTTAIGVGLGLIAAVQLGSALSQFAALAKTLRLTAISTAIIRGLTNPALLIGGLAAAAIGGGIIANMLDKSDDLMSGYGNRTLVTPQGAYALNNNDTVIAGTNLFRGNDVYSGPKDSINLGGSIDYDKLASAMSKVQVVSQVRVSEFGTPITTYQQQNMRRSV
jgi:hypothetical protein